MMNWEGSRKIYIKYFGVVLVTLLLSSCSLDKTEQKEKEAKTVEEKVMVVDSPTTELNLFELSVKEEEVYKKFQKDLNLIYQVD